MIDNDILNKVIEDEINNRLYFSLNKKIQDELNNIQNNQNSKNSEYSKELFVFLYTLICGTDRNKGVIECFLSLYNDGKVEYFNHFGSHTILRHKEIDYIKGLVDNFKLYRTLYLKELKDNGSLIDENLTFVENFDNVFRIVKGFKDGLFKQLATFDFLQNLYLFGIYNISPSEKEDLQYIINKFNNTHTSKTKEILNYSDLKDIIISFSKDNYSSEEYKKILNMIGYVIEGVYCVYGREISKKEN